MPYVVVNKKQQKAKRRKFFTIFMLVSIALIVVAIVIVLNVYWKSTLPTLIEIAQTRISAQTIAIVNQSVSTAIADTHDFEKLLTIERDDEGNVVLLTSNTAQVNQLARKTAILSQQKLNELAKEQIEIPFGTISGIPLFSEMGPDVVITVTPIGAVNCTFTSTFESVGINQTLHRMYVNVQCKIDLIIPQSHYLTEHNVPILICESVIVGKVPSTYLQGGVVLGEYSS